MRMILLSFILTVENYNELIKKVIQCGISIIESTNPFWNENGKMIQDPDGYRIVISPLKAVISEIE